MEHIRTRSLEQAQRLLEQTQTDLTSACQKHDALAEQVKSLSLRAEQLATDHSLLVRGTIVMSASGSPVGKAALDVYRLLQDIKDIEPVLNYCKWQIDVDLPTAITHYQNRINLHRLITQNLADCRAVVIPHDITPKAIFTALRCEFNADAHLAALDNGSLSGVDMLDERWGLLTHNMSDDSRLAVALYLKGYRIYQHQTTIKRCDALVDESDCFFSQGEQLYTWVNRNYNNDTTTIYALIRTARLEAAQRDMTIAQVKAERAQRIAQRESERMATIARIEAQWEVEDHQYAAVSAALSAEMASRGVIALNPETVQRIKREVLSKLEAGNS